MDDGIMLRVADRGHVAAGRAGSARAVISFPTLARLQDGVLVGTIRVGSSKDGDDEEVLLVRSEDDGRTWSPPERSLPGWEVSGVRGTGKVVYLTPMGDGRVIAAALWVDREAYPGSPLFDPDTEGCLPMAILLSESVDGCRTWTPWRIVDLPDELGPPSLTSPLLRFHDGSLGLSIETNKQYEDAGPWRQRAVLVRSEDDGRTWGPPVVIAEDPTGRRFNWDLRIAVGPDGTCASFAWTYDTHTAEFLDIHRRVSHDHGRSWSDPEPLGISDQPARPAVLDDGRTVLAYVDRFGAGTVSAVAAPSLAAPFATGLAVVLHAQERSGGEGVAEDETGLGALSSPWSFGLPFGLALPDGDVLVVYYAGDDSATDARWVRLSLEADAS
jgi:hypothetical protein